MARNSHTIWLIFFFRKKLTRCCAFATNLCSPLNPQTPCPTRNATISSQTTPSNWLNSIIYIHIYTYIHMNLCIFVRIRYLLSTVSLPQWSLHSDCPKSRWSLKKFFGLCLLASLKSEKFTLYLPVDFFVTPRILNTRSLKIYFIQLSSCVSQTHITYPTVSATASLVHNASAAKYISIYLWKANKKYFLKKYLV